MKILLLSDFNSIHTIRWAKSLAGKGITLLLVSFSNHNSDIFNNYKNIRVSGLGIPNSTITSSNNFSKLKYIRLLPKLKKLIDSFKPDILHAHYASSYGLLGTLSGFSPFILSVWGSDVFDFPKKSFIHKSILVKNFKKADAILSTSKIMAQEIQQYTNKEVTVTPFGVDTSLFYPKQTKSLFNNDSIVIGTIKSLEQIYGIDILIKSFKLLTEKFPNLPLKLLIVGDGTQKKVYRKMVSDFKLEDNTIFTGKIPYEKIPDYHNMIDIPVFLSNSESFGVAVIEASACEKPVVISNVGGLPEVVENGQTGLIVPPKNPNTASEAIAQLIMDKNLSKQMGQAGRKHVMLHFDWQTNVEQMITIYNKFTNK